MFKCEICGKEFKNKRALGSHKRYKHGIKKNEKGKGGIDILEDTIPAEDSIDLRDELLKIMSDLGVKRGARTIIDIFFDYGGEDLNKLDELLKLVGVPVNIRKIIIERYAQRIGKSEEAKKIVQEDEKENDEDDILKIYEFIERRELKRLLLEDLKLRIAEKRKELGLDKEEDKERESKEEKEEELEINYGISLHHRSPCPCSNPSIWCSIHYVGDEPKLYCSLMSILCPYYTPVELMQCQCGLMFNISNIKLNDPFRCPKCGYDYIKTAYGRFTVVSTYIASYIPKAMVPEYITKEELKDLIVNYLKEKEEKFEKEKKAEELRKLLEDISTRIKNLELEIAKRKKKNRHILSKLKI